jgi:selenocysteine lyase/cysteine desulfurase
VLPVEKIIKHAKNSGIETIVDAAHSFAQMPLDIQKLNCDYLAAPGHKWLGSIFGTGFLFIKKQHISKTYPLLSAFEIQKNDIRKFETLGTRPFANEVAFLQALNVHKAIGQQLIQQRLQYLTKYWHERATAIKGVESYTEISQSCNALATIQLKNISAESIEKELLKNYNIHVGVVKHGAIEGIRVSPHIYTSLDELDKLIKSVKAISHS